MSATIEMASPVLPKLPYHRLKPEQVLSDEIFEGKAEKFMLRSRSSWFRYRRVHLRKRFKVKVPGLTRFLRRKVRVVSTKLAKVLKRLKQGRSHFGDLFAGNYLFLQVNPCSFNHLKKSCYGTTGFNLHFPSRFSLPKTA